MCTPMNENWSNFLNKLSERLNKMLDYVEKLILIKMCCGKYI